MTPHRTPRRFARPLTFANVAACLAVVLAIGGTAWASGALPRNSVGNAQLKDDAVTGREVRKGSLRASDFGGALPRGPRGPQGPRGAQGAAATLGDPFQQFVSTSLEAGGSEACATVAPPDGRRLVIESVQLDVIVGQANIAPNVYVRTAAFNGNGTTNYIRAAAFPMTRRGPSSSQSWSGIAAMQLYTGTPSPGGQTYSYAVCTAGAGLPAQDVRAIVSGHLL